jgi:hypothetical protein
MLAVAGSISLICGARATVIVWKPIAMTSFVSQHNLWRPSSCLDDLIGGHDDPTFMLIPVGTA